MASQLFKNHVPLDILISFLNSCTDEKYTFGRDAYKKSCINGSLDCFLNKLKDFYFSSKQYYVNRKMSYKNIVTIIRQVCKHLNIPYTSKILYGKSSYEIIYYIYPDHGLTDIVADQQLSHNGIAF